MKRALTFIGVGLFFVLFAGSFVVAGDHGPAWQGFYNTTWTGDVTFMDPDDNATISKGVTLIISEKPEVDGFFKGTLVFPDSSFNFSGVVDRLNPFSVQMTAIGYVMHGDLRVKWSKDDQVEQRKPHVKKYQLLLRGSDIATGRTFMGIFTMDAAK